MKINNHIIYVLKLEDDCWYIGWTTTNCFKQRMKDHWAQLGKGSKWSELHKPVRVYDIETYDRSLTGPEIARIEDSVTLKYGAIYGYDKVRGGGYSQMFPMWPPPKVKVKQRKKNNGLTNKQIRAIARANKELRASTKLSN